MMSRMSRFLALIRAPARALGLRSGVGARLTRRPGSLRLSSRPRLIRFECEAHVRDTVQARPHDPRLPLSLRVLSLCIPEMETDLPNRLPAPVELPRQRPQLALDVPRPLLELHAAEAVEDDQQIRVERVRRHGNHA